MNAIQLMLMPLVDVQGLGELLVATTAAYQSSGKTA